MATLQVVACTPRRPARADVSGLGEPPALRLPEGARPTRYAVELTLLPQEATFSGRVSIDLSLARAMSGVWLHGADLKVEQAWFEAAGERQPARVRDEHEGWLGFELERGLAAGSAVLTIQYAGKILDNEAIGIFHRQHKGESYLFTQFQPLDARRAFPCFDEPRFRTPWVITLHVPAADTAVSNTPIERERLEPGGTRAVQFQQTEPLPAYLVAFAVGPFELLQGRPMGMGATPFRLLLPKGESDQAALARALVPELFEPLERSFGIAYPYRKLDVVGVPNGHGLAMENAGLITIASDRLLLRAEQAPVDRRRALALLLGHELAHQWLGDLVSPSWWDDLWLSEAFAQWMEKKALAAREVADPGAAAARYRLEEREQAMASDALASARVIRQPIASNDDIANAFDSITYSKGAAILEMFEHWVGPEVFRRAVRRYLETHRSGVTTVSDFLAALEAEAGGEAPAAFATFLDRPGVPLISVSLRCERSGAAALELRQERDLPAGSAAPPAPPWSVPVCLRFGAGSASERRCALVTQARQTVPLESCPQWIWPDEGGSGYYRVRLEEELLDRIAQHLEALTAPERLSLLANLEARTARGELASEREMALIVAAAAEPDPSVAAAAVDLVDAVDRPVLPEELAQRYDRYLAKTFAPRLKALGEPEGGDARLLQAKLMLLLGRRSGDAQLIARAREGARTWLAHPEQVPPELVEAFLGVAARSEDPVLHQALVDRLATSTEPLERAQVTGALALVDSPALLPSQLALILDGKVNAWEAQRLFIGTRPVRSAAARFELIRDHYDRLLEIIPRDAQTDLFRVGEGFCDAERARAFRATFQERARAVLGGERVVAQVAEGIELCAARRERLVPALSRFLSRR
ncbi:MAG TPA: M1 family metallopeptidase [Myxococcaceae bacterium]